MIYNYLNKALKYYLIAGIALCLVIIAILLLGKYEKSLSAAVTKQENIRINIVKIEQAIKDMDSTVKKIDALLPTDYSSRSHRELLLLVLDDFKKIFKRSEITVMRFEEKEGELFLPVNIKFPIDDYSILLQNIGYLQSMKAPHFTIKQLSIEETVDKQANVVICVIEGLLKMPVERLKEVKS